MVDTAAGGAGGEHRGAGAVLAIGRDILGRQDSEGWGARVVDRLAADLRAEFPDQRGSRSKLLYMRAFAAGWPDLGEVVPQAVGQLPWGHVRTLLDRLDNRPERDWCAARAVDDGWSRAVLDVQLRTTCAPGSGSHRRTSPTASPRWTPTSPRP